MRLKTFLGLLLAASLALGGCATERPTVSPTPLTSGLEGQALLGPQCPVVQADTPCPDVPYADATLTVLDAAGKEVARLHTDETGNFRLLLLPGQYTLRPEPPAGMPFPNAPEQTFSVVDGQFTSLTLLFDTGIR